MKTEIRMYEINEFNEKRLHSGTGEPERGGVTVILLVNGRKLFLPVNLLVEK